MIHIAWSPDFCHPLPPEHRFPMVKYNLIKDQLIWESVIEEHQLFDPPALALQEAAPPHTKEYLGHLLEGNLSPREQRILGFPLNPALLVRELKICQGTLTCAMSSLSNGVGLNCAGGTHHAFRDRGEGFCLLNDFAVALHILMRNNKIKKALIIDLDVHQGNGSAAIFASEDRVFTFSMHGANNYPFKKECSDLDIELKDGTTDGMYLKLLEESLVRLIDQVKPDLACYQSGVDILTTDKFGKLAITPQGCRTRDDLVFQFLSKKNIPCVVAMGGGYSPEIKDVVNAHCETFKAAMDAYI